MISQEKKKELIGNNAIQLHVALAACVRQGTVKMPDVAKLSHFEAIFFCQLVADDDFFNFWFAMKAKSEEFVRAVVDIRQKYGVSGEANDMISSAIAELKWNK